MEVCLKSNKCSFYVVSAPETSINMGDLIEGKINLEINKLDEREFDIETEESAVAKEHITEIKNKQNAETAKLLENTFNMQEVHSEKNSVVKTTGAKVSEAPKVTSSLNSVGQILLTFQCLQLSYDTISTDVTKLFLLV